MCYAMKQSGAENSRKPNQDITRLGIAFKQSQPWIYTSDLIVRAGLIK